VIHRSLVVIGNLTMLRKRPAKKFLPQPKVWKTGVNHPPPKRASNAKWSEGTKTRSSTKAEREIKAKYEQYRRRRWCVAKKSHELKTLCNVKVFLLIEDELRSHYFSTEELSDHWPTPWEKLVRKLRFVD
jgi:hypothetical protein